MIAFDSIYIQLLAIFLVQERGTKTIKHAHSFSPFAIYVLKKRKTLALLQFLYTFQFRLVSAEPDRTGKREKRHYPEERTKKRFSNSVEE